MCKELLGTLANLAAIATAAVAIYGYIQYRVSKWRKRKRVEDYLWKLVTNPARDDYTYARPIEQLIAALKMTEAEVMEAIHENKNVYVDLFGPPGPLSMRLQVKHIDTLPDMKKG
jgi:hypothetical protein